MTARIVDVMSAEGTAHENTTTEGTIKKWTFKANSLQPGQVYPFGCAIIVNNSNSTDTLIAGVRFGTDGSAPVNNTDCGRTAAIDVANADTGAAIGFLEVRASGEVVIYGMISSADASGTAPAFSFAKVITGLDFTAALYLDVTLDWSVANANNQAAAPAGHLAVNV